MIKIKNVFHAILYFLIICLFAYLSFYIINTFVISIILFFLLSVPVIYYGGGQINYVVFNDDSFIYRNLFSHRKISYNEILKVDIYNGQGGSVLLISLEFKSKIRKIKVFSDSDSKLMQAFDLMKKKGVVSENRIIK